MGLADRIELVTVVTMPTAHKLAWIDALHAAGQ